MKKCTEKLEKKVKEQQEIVDQMMIKLNKVELDFALFKKDFYDLVCGVERNKFEDHIKNKSSFG